MKYQKIKVVAVIVGEYSLRISEENVDIKYINEGRETILKEEKLRRLKGKLEKFIENEF